MKTKTITLLIVSLGQFIPACNGATATPTTGPQVQTWIDAPLPNATIPQATYQLVFHGASFNGLEEFEVSVNGQVDGMVAPLISGSGGPQQGTLFYGEYPWTPPAPGTYLISVRAKNGQQQFGPPVQVQVFVGDLIADADDQVPLLQPTTTTTLQVEASCTYIAVVNLFCRTGPGQVYPEVDSFVPADVTEVIGISPDSTHVQVLGPNFGEACFVPVEERFGQLDGTCDDLEVVTIPPTPTPTLTPTPEPQPSAEPTTAPPALPQCSDGIDNDGDGRIDMRDRECWTPDDNDESSNP